LVKFYYGNINNYSFFKKKKLRINNRPAYHPEEGKLVSDIQKAWNDLSIVEKNRNTFLHKEKDR
jgi:hypothetical protein